MIRHAWSVLCEKSLIDRDTNNLSLDVLEQLNVRIPKLPLETKGIFIPRDMQIVSLWYRFPFEPGETGKARLKIKTAAGEDVAEAPLDIDLVTAHRHRSRSSLDGLPIPKDFSGFFHFVVELQSEKGWQEVARLPLEVQVEEIEA